MTDEIDTITEQSAIINDTCIAAVARKAAQIPAGYKGQCVECGCESLRLVQGRCAPCRDEGEGTL